MVMGRVFKWGDRALNSSFPAQNTDFCLVMIDTCSRMIDPELPLNLLIGKSPL